MTQWNKAVTQRNSSARLSLHIAPGFLQKSIWKGARSLEKRQRLLKISFQILRQDIGKVVLHPPPSFPSSD